MFFYTLTILCWHCMVVGRGYLSLISSDFLKVHYNFQVRDEKRNLLSHHCSRKVALSEKSFPQLLLLSHLWVGQGVLTFSLITAWWIISLLYHLSLFTSHLLPNNAHISFPCLPVKFHHSSFPCLPVKYHCRIGSLCKNYISSPKFFSCFQPPAFAFWIEDFNCFHASFFYIRTSKLFTQEGSKWLRLCVTPAL